MLNFVKKYWFTTLITIFIVLYLTVFLCVLFSPKTDKLNRGFIPCTEQMTAKMLQNKEQSSFALAKIIIENTYCDAKVVAKGLTNWVKGEQSTPWANYFFEPEIEPEIVPNDEELLKFYEENPYLSKDMEELDKKRQELEQQINNAQIKEESQLVEPFDFDENTIEDKEQTDDKQ